MNWEQIDLKWGSGFTWAGAPETGVCQEEGAIRARGLACACRMVVSGCCVSECKSLEINDVQDWAPLSYLQHLEDSVAAALDGTHSEQGLSWGNFCQLWLADKDFYWLCFLIKRTGSTICAHFSLCRFMCEMTYVKAFWSYKMFDVECQLEETWEEPWPGYQVPWVWICVLLIMRCGVLNCVFLFIKWKSQCLTDLLWSPDEVVWTDFDHWKV